jgi:hypothetical protein
VVKGCGRLTTDFSPTNKNTISPGWSTTFFTGVVIVGEEIVFVGWGKEDWCFDIFLERFQFFLVESQLISFHQRGPIAVFYEVSDKFVAHVDSIVEISTPKDEIMPVWSQILGRGIFNFEKKSKTKSRSLIALVLTAGKTSFLLISPKSLFLSATFDWPAAKCEQQKQREELYSWKRIATPPLLPVAPPNPVLTIAVATSLTKSQKDVIPPSRVTENMGLTVNMGHA